GPGRRCRARTRRATSACRSPGAMPRRGPVSWPCAKCRPSPHEPSRFANSSRSAMMRRPRPQGERMPRISRRTVLEWGVGLAAGSDLAEGLGKQLGGWYDVARTYGYSNKMKHWIAVPVGGTVQCLTYRTGWVKEAGFEQFPKTLPDLLNLAKALKTKGHPMGFALGHAVGDGNNWTHWLLWTFGGKAVEKDTKTIAIAQKPSLDAIEYAKELYAQMAPGVASWLDPNNNRAFLAGEISLTNNGISIYYAAKKDFPQIAEDINHSPFPIGSVGRPTELANFSQAFIFRHSRFPNAAKEYIRFMLSPDQAGPWVDAMNGYVTPALKHYRDLPVWTKDPKATPFRDGIARMQHNGYAGEPGQQAAAALAEFIVLDMFADATVNGMSAKDSAARAESRLRRIYRS